MFVSTVQTYPIQYRSNRSACFLRSQTPSPPYCRDGDPPPASRRRRSGRRSEAGWPWSDREANGTKIDQQRWQTAFPLGKRVPTVPGSKRALMSSKISATRMAKDRLAWMWYRWLRMVLTELKRHPHVSSTPSDETRWREDTHDKTAKVPRVMVRQKMEMEQPT